MQSLHDISQCPPMQPEGWSPEASEGSWVVSSSYPGTSAKELASLDAAATLALTRSAQHQMSEHSRSAGSRDLKQLCKHAQEGAS